MLVECYLFGYTGDAYGKKVRIEFLEFHRPEKKFQNVEALKTVWKKIFITEKIISKDKGEYKWIW